MIIEIGRFRISPHESGLCWQLHEFKKVRHNDGTATCEWVSMGRYPSSLDGALRQVSEMKLRESDADKLHEVLDRLDLLAEAIRDAAARIEASR
jgi:hypothetical protein